MTCSNAATQPAKSGSTVGSVTGRAGTAWQRGPMDVRSERRFRFDATPTALWAALDSVDDYSRWWPWLHHFDARALAAGEEWRCTVKPPLPYVVRFTIRLDEVQ